MLNPPKACYQSKSINSSQICFPREFSQTIHLFKQLTKIIFFKEAILESPYPDDALSFSLLIARRRRCASTLARWSVVTWCSAVFCVPVVAQICHRVTTSKSAALMLCWAEHTHVRLESASRHWSKKSSLRVVHCSRQQYQQHQRPTCPVVYLNVLQRKPMKSPRCQPNYAETAWRSAPQTLLPMLSILKNLLVVSWEAWKLIRYRSFDLLSCATIPWYFSPQTCNFSILIFISPQHQLKLLMPLVIQYLCGVICTVICAWLAGLHCVQKPVCFCWESSAAWDWDTWPVGFQRLAAKPCRPCPGA